MSNNIQHILGLDLGTNSIGWALVEIDHVNHLVRIMMMGSRIIPMKPSEIALFENGGHMKSPAADRRQNKQPRRMNERFILRRDRLNYVLNLYSMLPNHYKLEIDFETPEGLHSGKFKYGKEPKIAYCLNEGKHKDGVRDKYDFIFQDQYEKMVADLTQKHPHLKHHYIPKDWTLYYLRKKALTEEITLEQLSWVLHSFNKKRGYEKVEGVDDDVKDTETRTCSVTGIKSEGNLYTIQITDENNPSWHYTYQQESTRPMVSIGDFKQVEIKSSYDEDGNYDERKTQFIIKEIISLKAVQCTRENKTFQVVFDNGWEFGMRKSILTNVPSTLICTEEYRNDGTLKSRSMTLVEEKDKKKNWAYIKLGTETQIAKYNREHGTKGVASYIYDNLLSNNPDRLHTKIIGGLVESIDRTFYHDEVVAILTNQAKFHNDFTDHYQEAIDGLYPHNEGHRRLLMQQSFAQLVADDILFYQRELRSKKSEINDCRFEVYRYKKDGKEVIRRAKAAHTANPYHQEFRIWKFINQLRIYEEPNEEHASPLDVTDQYLAYEYDIKAALFDEFQKHKTIKVSVLKKAFMKLPNKGKGFTWSYPSDHEEKGNETRYEFMTRLRKVKGFDDWEKFLDATHLDNGKPVSNEYMLWHFFYSVKRKSQRTKGLPTLIARLLSYAQMPPALCDEIVKQFSTFGSYKSQYGAYSEKALLKLLPLMRCGKKYWDAEAVAQITGEDKEWQGMMEQGSEEHPGAVNIVYAAALLALNKERWQSPHDIRQYLKKGFKQNSLRNPVVEKVVREMLNVVHDIWQYNLDQNANFRFDEIHVELGRELKRTPKQKANDVNTIKGNQLANHRAELLLREIGLNDKSPFLREKYRIYEDCIMSAIRIDKPDTKYSYIDEYGKMQQVTKSDIMAWQKDMDEFRKHMKTYKLWLNKRFSSPYTGLEIEFKEIFDRTMYEREHTLPQERVTLNSLKNLFMCETAINKAKTAMTGMEFIKKYGGKKVKGFRILTVDQYRKWVDDNVHDPQRREILLSEQIPARFTDNQLNNTRYISRLASTLLSRIVRTEDEQGALATGMVTVNGSVTAMLRHDWRMGEVWNKLIAPRFLRMNSEVEKLTGEPSCLFGKEREIDGKMVFIPEVPEQLRDGFEKKRIDHRHHALDALVVALTHRNHINYINNVAGSNNAIEALDIRRALKHKYTITKKLKDKSQDTRFLPPAQYKEGGKVVPYRYTYTLQDGKAVTSAHFEKVVLEAMRDTLVTFKQNERIMSPRQNVYQHWDEKKGRLVKVKEEGLKDERKWCFRHRMSKYTIYGKRIINSKEYKISKANNLVDMLASMDVKALQTLFESNTIIPDKAVRDILSNYLKYHNNDPQVAFSQEGLSYMNAHIKDFTPNGKCHMPIKKISILSNFGTAHVLTNAASVVKSKQYYIEDPNVRCYFYSNGFTKVKSLMDIANGKEMPEGYAFTLCPNDLVYVPNDAERKRAEKLAKRKELTTKEIGLKRLDPNNLYRIVSFEPGTNTSKVKVTPATLAQMVVTTTFDAGGTLKDNAAKDLQIKGEFSITTNQDESMQGLFTDKTIRDVCWKVVLDRLGRIDHLITRSGIRVNP